MGSFDTKYLDVPEEVLKMTSMKHQRYFCCTWPWWSASNSPSVMGTLSTWKMLSSKDLGVLKMVNFLAWRPRLRLKTSLLNWRTWPSMKSGSLSEHGACRYCAASLAETSWFWLQKKQQPNRSCNKNLQIWPLTTGMFGEFDELPRNHGWKIRPSRVKMLRLRQLARDTTAPDSADGALQRLGWCHSCPCG